MGLLDLFRKDSVIGMGAKSFIPENMTTFELPPGSTSFTAGMVAEMVSNMRGMNPRTLWETQHNIRMVVDFLSRNIAQLGLHAYRHDGNGGRERVRGTELTKLLGAPNPQMTTYDLVVSLVSDLALFDQAWWYIREARTGWEIRPLSVDRVTRKSGREIDGNLVIRYDLGDGQGITIKQENLLHFRGWSPAYGEGVSPAIHTLRNVLAEQVASQEFRLKVWENGGQMASYIQRPKDAPDWSDAAASRFREDMKGYRAGAGNAGSMPVLEDGMEIKQTRFNAKDEQWAEAAQLALETVARTFHINPAMLGATGGVSYANVREFRKMLYGETLGPWLRMIQDRLNRFLVPKVGAEDGVYLEFNVKAKLAASFDEQAAVMSSAVGRPWMTANEARVLENMPALDGDADSLVTPLNVIVGGQASPRDSDSSKGSEMRVKSRDPIRIKAEPDAESSVMLAQILAKFFARQKSAVLSKIEAGGDWWDGERWDKELSEDLFKVAVSLFGRVGSETLRQAGFDAEGLDEARAEAFLKAVAESRARMVNEATRGQIEAALDGDVSDDAQRATPAGVFELAESTRGKTVATTLLTTFASFATTEAAKQAAGDRATKTWQVRSTSPRASHATLNGETVGVGEKFSNGSDWPGDPSLGADGVAGCLCGLEISIP